jgi:hypothetical protein
MGGTSSKEAPAKENSVNATASKPVKYPGTEKLPPALQKIVDDEETLLEQLYDGK